jgi:imidazoleglycerol phosphate synthase cyclase subunit
MLDVSATLEGRLAMERTIADVRAAISIPLTIGGGVRDVDDARALLAAGADRVGVNSAAVRDPSIVDALADEFGRQCIVVAIDAKARHGSWSVVTHAGQTVHEINAVDWAQESVRRGAGEILLTSWDRDGSRAGYDLNLIRAVSARIAAPVIASGGASNVEHIAEAFKAGASAALAASIFHDGDMTVREVKERLAQMQYEVRL